MTEVGALLADRYRLERQLGSGGMGVVWLATDELLQRPVAVKQLNAAEGASPEVAEEARQRAMREGRIAARLHHPNAVAVHDVTQHDGFPVLIMEYLPSRSLAEVLAGKGRMTPGAVASMGAQAAAALEAAHAAGITHRDIKPGNILLGDDGTAKITDFGISHAADDVAVTRTGVIAGTPAYLAPEVARGQAPTPASDVYSLGATLYAAVEGAPPFGDESTNSIALLHEVAAGDFRPPQLAGVLAPVLTHMLQVDPAQRPTPAQAREALQAVVSGAPSPLPDLDQTRPIAAAAPAPADSGTRLDNVPVSTPRRSRRGLYIAAAAVAVVLVVLAVLLPFRNQQQPQEQLAAPGELERVVSDYYALLPEHPGNAWTRLGPGLQAQGRAGYEGFWSTVADVRVVEPPKATGPDAVRVTVELVLPDRTRITELHQLGLRGAQRPLIESDSILNSSTSTPPPPPPPPPARVERPQDDEKDEKREHRKGDEDRKGGDRKGDDKKGEDN
ncbi:serine/threonine protein kinase [Saccharopolyspora rhizosphaerae]|uniref:non-specific serine/threonine protein kinase n=1 Tax=Saccharopolyspora rhizosphaerae TaxID=2492662 RepID=A0A426JLW4_9PSEU|nr:serine/threonine-protein kinase [Saccharopolyspora rhizosphaerae]RRO14213.1 serine/threonine protein kinase [Saccharopolyspora rhizosphaerae]